MIIPENNQHRQMPVRYILIILLLYLDTQILPCSAVDRSNSAVREARDRDGI